MPTNLENFNCNNNEEFLKAADKIGTRLCKEAIWHGNKCNWMGKTMEGTNPPFTPINRALVPDIYDGSSGIALFLSYLYAITQKNEYFVTAEGAINRSLYKNNDIDSLSRFGFFSGKVGIAYAATKIGMSIKCNRLIQDALDILIDLSKDLDSIHSMDVISGNASAIPALLDMYDVFKEEKIYNLAISLGMELLRSAIKEPVGWSWGNTANSIAKVYHNLTGFAHGAAGVGYSLLELFRKSTMRKFLEGAEKAFEYEDYWFNKEKDNWPEFRIDNNSPTTVNDDNNFTYSTAWCHGAPGIGLSRLRAYDILKKDQYRIDSEAAIRTTMLLSQKRLGTYSETNYSLCHGLAGICETLQYASQIFDKKNNLYQPLYLQVAIQGINQYIHDNVPWPCGALCGEVPGLLLGLAGIGYFYLRLYDPNRVPSILILLPK